MGKNEFSLENELVIDGAENTGINFQLAGMGNRMLAFLLDSLITGVLSVAAMVVLILPAVYFAPASETLTYIIITALILSLFLIQWGYFIIFELIWHGQTPGKKALRIKVVCEDGRPVGFVPSLLRNLMRIMDMLPTAYAVGLLTMFINSREKRLGDMVGGTIVIKEPRAAFPVVPANRPLIPSSDRFYPWSLEQRMHHLTTAEIELLRDFLERRHTLEQEPRRRLGAKLARHFARRFDLDIPADTEHFLEYLATLS